MLTEALYKVNDMIKEHDDPLKLWIGNDLYILFTEPETYKILYNHHKCLNKANLYEMVDVVFGHGLVTAPGM